MLRSHKLNEINENLIGRKVSLCGWVDTIRIHRNVVFLDLRDRHGKVQCVISKKSSEDFAKVKDLSVESSVKIIGEIKARPRGSENEKLASGKVEVVISSLEVYNKAPRMPFDPNEKNLNEDVRLKYRFLDLRGERMQKNLNLRSEVFYAILNYFKKKGFIYFETPILGKSTPEGARDFLVPSRKHIGKFYALPQSPQLFKQLSQISCFDNYIQVARCFRDEDARKDRQLEFTQVDIEMSFVEQKDILKLLERMVYEVFKEVKGIKLKLPFPRMTYKEAMEKYGKDNPDLREETGEEFAFCWIVDFPAFKYSEEEKRYKAVHHPFTMPRLDKEGKFDENSLSYSYDLVLNGSEIGGGSIRIHDETIQKKVFGILKIGSKEAEKKFGFLLKALSYGAPPHGGFALGLDRFVQIMAGEDSIRDVIAFPKNKDGMDTMLEAPSRVSKEQLDELGLQLKKRKR